eukprot:maker-scaffold652_size119135-snap-gene-0.15 protein:Tk02005 transcript:maker-scaffold652_size119135-snap-gene-0.15-mRNA-1 annotation:"probable imidazolonepropionase"
MKLCLHGAEQIVQVVKDGRSFLTGTDMRNLAILKARHHPTKLDAKDGLTVLVSSDGRVSDLGYDSDVLPKYQDTIFDVKMDVSGHCILPGLIDGHTHPVWAGDRVHEFAMKLAGATYMEVHEAGGGINFTVDHTRKASHQELEDLLIPRLNEMLNAGTTTVECKSGYGLDAENEIKMLEVLESAAQKVPIEISGTFCGAHSIPKGSNAEAATQDVIEVQLPKVVALKKQGLLNTIENIDVFCEKGVFDRDQSEAILKAGQKEGLRINFHGDELNCLNGAEMGASINAEAISHLEEISHEGIQAMAQSGSVAVILPTTAYILRLKSPPVRKMIDEGVIVALGSDFNPNAHCLTMPTVMHLACVNQYMSMEETLAAATINAAHSLGRGKTHGSIEVGKVADLLLTKTERWEHLIYQLGSHMKLITMVVKGGKVVKTPLRAGNR